MKLNISELNFNDAFICIYLRFQLYELISVSYLMIV